MYFIQSVQIDFNVIEQEIMEHQLREIIWDESEEGQRMKNRIYSAINNECSVKVEEGKLTPCELFQWIIDALIEECEIIGIEIIEIDEGGNPIEIETEQD